MILAHSDTTEDILDLRQLQLRGRPRLPTVD